MLKDDVCGAMSHNELKKCCDYIKQVNGVLKLAQLEFPKAAQHYSSDLTRPKIHPNPYR